LAYGREEEWHSLTFSKKYFPQISVILPSSRETDNDHRDPEFFLCTSVKFPFRDELAGHGMRTSVFQLEAHAEIMGSVLCRAESLRSGSSVLCNRRVSGSSRRTQRNPDDESCCWHGNARTKGFRRYDVLAHELVREETHISCGGGGRIFNDICLTRHKLNPSSPNPGRQKSRRQTLTFINRPPLSQRLKFSSDPPKNTTVITPRQNTRHPRTTINFCTHNSTTENKVPSP
jgi:hypothetical protein